MANITACLSSNSCEWTTPDELFRQLDDEFHFNLDPCSTDANAKCERHFTIADDGLSQNWGGGIVCFAIRRMDAQSARGWKNVSTNPARRTPLLFS